MGATKKASRYQKRQPLSENAFTTLHLGVDLKTGRPVLLRGFKATLFGKESDWLEFHKQLDERRKIQVPGILPALGMIGNPTQPTLVIAGTNGRSLRNALSDSIEIHKGLAALSPVAQALDELHRLGFAHGDVRPETLFFTEDNRLALNELATHYALCGWHQSLQEMHPNFFGSVFPVTYLAPELQSGGVVSDRTDQYALGLVALELCTGVTPRVGTNPQDVLAGLGVPPEKQPLLDQLRPVLSRALSPDPAGRYPSCQEFLEHADRELNPSSPAKWVGAGLALAVLLVVIVLGLQLGSSQPETVQDAGGKKAAEAEIASRYQWETPRIPTFDASPHFPPDDTTAANGLLEEARAAIAEKQFAALKSQLKTIDLAIQGMPPAEKETIRFFYALDPPTVTYLGKEDSSSWQIRMEFVEGLPQQKLELRAELFDVDTLDPLRRIDFFLGETGSVLSHDKLHWTPEARTLTIDLGPVPPPQPKGTSAAGWPLGTGLSVRLMIQNADKPVLWRQSRAYHLGELQNYDKQWSLIPAEVRAEGFQMATGVPLSLGQEFRLTASGTIQPGTEEKSLQLTRKKERAEMGPSGLRIKDPQHRFVSDQNAEEHKLPEHRWGALLMKVGEKTDWEWPDSSFPSGPLDVTQTAARDGMLYLSIDSVTAQYDPVKKTRVSVSNDDFWQPAANGGGKFDVTLQTRKLLPRDLPLAIANKVLQHVEKE